VFLSCCNVFLKCSLHLYHANQFVVMMMMMILGIKWKYHVLTWRR